MGIPVLGRCSEVTELAASSGADIVFFVDGGVSSADEMRRVAWDFEHRDIQVVVAPSITDVAGDRVTVRPVGGLPLIHIEPPRSINASRWGKRLFDLAGSLGLLVVLSPLLLVATLRVALPVTARSSSARPGWVATASSSPASSSAPWSSTPRPSSPSCTPRWVTMAGCSR